MPAFVDYVHNYRKIDVQSKSVSVWTYVITIFSILYSFFFKRLACCCGDKNGVTGVLDHRREPVGVV